MKEVSNMKKLIKKLLSFTLVVSMVMSMTATAFATSGPRDSLSVNTTGLVQELFPELNNKEIAEIEKELNNFLNHSSQDSSRITLSSNGNLYWGPVTVGDIQLKIIGPHAHKFGKFSYPVEHINFHVDKVNNSGKIVKNVANYHIAKYTSNGKDCLYVYDSVSRSTLIDRCDSNWKDTVKDVVSAASKAAAKVSSEGNWIVKAALWATAVVIIIDLVLPMDPIPVIPFSNDNLVLQ